MVVRVWSKFWRGGISGAFGCFFSPHTLLQLVVSILYIKVVWGKVEAGNVFLAVIFSV